MHPMKEWNSRIDPLAPKYTSTRVKKKKIYHFSTIIFHVLPNTDDGQSILGDAASEKTH